MHRRPNPHYRLQVLDLATGVVCSTVERRRLDALRFVAHAALYTEAGYRGLRDRPIAWEVLGKLMSFNAHLVQMDVEFDDVVFRITRH